MIPSVGGPIRVVIIDDETLFAHMLGSWLERDPGLRIEGYAESGNQGWELCAATRPDLALVDVEMPDGDGLALAKRLLDELPGDPCDHHDGAGGSAYRLASRTSRGAGAHRQDHRSRRC